MDEWLEASPRDRVGLVGALPFGAGLSVPITADDVRAAQRRCRLLHVARLAHTACRIEIDDLVRKHAESRIELRIVDALWPLWDRVASSTLKFSGIRLRNARPPQTPSSSYALLPR